MNENYKLSRTITTVVQVWKEWDTGLTSNTEAVSRLEAVLGNSWRKDQKERKIFSLRKVIIDSILQVSETRNRTGLQVATMFEVRRDQLGKSLSALTKILSRPESKDAFVASIP